MPRSSKRLTIRVPTELLDRVEDLVDEGHFINRSDAVRAALRMAFVEPEDADWVDPRSRSEPMVRSDGGEDG